MASEQTKERIRQFFLRIPSVFGSIFFAILIWFFIAMTKRYTAASALPVVIKSDGAAQTVRSEYPKHVEVKLESEGWKLLSLYLGQIEWVIDLGNEVQKDLLEIETLRNAPQYIKPFPEGMRVLEVQPHLIELELDEKVTKRVPLKISSVFEAMAGYTIRPTLVISPDSVTISGAKSIVENIPYWKTSVKTFNNLVNDFQLEVELDDTLRGVVSRSASKIKVKGTSEQLSETEFVDIPVAFLKGKRPIFVTLIPNRVSLILSGAVSDLVKVKPESLAVFIDAEKLLADTTGFLLPSVKYPKGLELRRIHPEKLQYILRN